MGYYIRAIDLNVKIPVSKRSELLAVFKKLKDDEQKLGRGGEWSGGRQVRKWYSFANDFEYSEDISAMFDAFGYVCEEKNGHFVIDDYSFEKMGQDDLLWERMKPLVTEDSVCQFRGEDDALLDFLA